MTYYLHCRHSSCHLSTPSPSLQRRSATASGCQVPQPAAAQPPLLAPPPPVALAAAVPPAAARCLETTRPSRHPRYGGQLRTFEQQWASSWHDVPQQESACTVIAWQGTADRSTAAPWWCLQAGDGHMRRPTPQQHNAGATRVQQYHADIEAAERSALLTQQQVDEDAVRTHHQQHMPSLRLL